LKGLPPSPESAHDQRPLVDVLSPLTYRRPNRCDDAGLPDFYALHFHRGCGLCVWAFDILHFNGRDLRELPLFERKARLEKLILAANANWLRYSESFDDGIELLNRMKLEGIVSKRRNAPYRSGKQSDWIKVKCTTWRAANKECWRLFVRR
jgi:ATP-dependent DNA ligase